VLFREKPWMMSVCQNLNLATTATFNILKEEKKDG